MYTKEYSKKIYKKHLPEKRISQISITMSPVNKDTRNSYSKHSLLEQPSELTIEKKKEND